MLDTSTPFSEWPSGNTRGVIYLKIGMKEIQNRFGINKWVHEQHGPLNLWAHSAHFHDKVLGPVVFKCEEMPEHINTDVKCEILVDAGIDVERATERLIDVLDLQEKEIAIIAKKSDFIDL